MANRLIKKELFEVADQNVWKPWLIGGGTGLVILGVTLALMQSIGLFEIPRDDTGTKTLAATLGLIGAVLSAVITLIGIVVKYSIDDRSARRASLEASRNYALALEAEERNRIEAAIRAVDLLSENNKPSTMHQIGGALLALVSLGEHDLAVNLLATLWLDDEVSPSVAAAVIGEALSSDSTKTQNSAAVVLMQNASKIVQEGYNIWPMSDPPWDSKLPGNCRIGLIRAAIEWLKEDLRKNGTLLIPNSAVVLYQALRDPEPSIVDLAAGALKPVIQAFHPSVWITTGNVRLVVKEVNDRLKEVPETRLTDEAEIHSKSIANIIEAQTQSAENVKQ